MLKAKHSHSQSCARGSLASSSSSSSFDNIVDCTSCAALSFAFACLVLSCLVFSCVSFALLFLGAAAAHGRWLRASSCKLQTVSCKWRPMRRLLNLMHVCLHKLKPYWIERRALQMAAASSMYGHVPLPPATTAAATAAAAANDEQTSIQMRMQTTSRRKL